MTALVDTGFMLALLSRNDPHHSACRLANEKEQNPLIPSMVLPELAYMTIRGLGYEPFVLFMRRILQNPDQIVTTTEVDLARATDIMEKYASSRIDFVDCVIAAMAERLDITRILTIDHRHFRLFRPKHVSSFEILP